MNYQLKTFNMYLKSFILLSTSEIFHKALFLSLVIPKSIIAKNYCFQHIICRGKMNPRFEEIFVLVTRSTIDLCY